MKKTNRRTLLNAALKGQLYVKCAYHMTDDYAWDAANKNGRMAHYVQARIRSECTQAEAIRETINEHYSNGGTWCQEIEAMQEEVRHLYEQHRTTERRHNPGVVWMDESDFRTKSGHISGDKTSGNFSVHSNLNYDYMICADEPVTLELC